MVLSNLIQENCITPNTDVNPSPEGQGMLVIIDPSIPDSQHLARGVLEGATVFQLDPEVDGIAQISAYLKQNQGFTSLHLLCHGAPGSLYIGNNKLNLDNLKTYTHLLQHWQHAFTNFDLHLLLYGCQVAKGRKGREFVQAIAKITGANIAASVDLTGNAALEGTWQLEHEIGAIAADLAFKPEVMASYSSILATFTANNAAELIARINEANVTPEADTINLGANTTFNLTQAENVDNFYGATGLPVIVDDITINGNGSTIQRSSGPDFRIFLIAGPGTVGFFNGKGKLTLDNVTIKGGRAVGTAGATDDGGGVFNSGGQLIIRNSTITENYADDDGAGIINTGTGQGLAKATIENSTISKNIAKGDALDDGGGGIDNDGNKDSGALGAEMLITNSIITENQNTNGSGGGIRNVNGGVLTIRDSQISNNSSKFGSGIANGAAPGIVGTSLTLSNTKIENNSGVGLDVEDAFDQDGNTGPTTVVNDGGNTVTRTNAPELLANPPQIRVTIANGAAIADGQPTAIAFGNSIQGATQTFTTFNIENRGQDPLTLGLPVLVGASPNAFVLDTQGFQTTLNQNQSTSFKVALKTDTLGQFAATVNFAANDAQITDPFNFDIAGGITPPAPQIRVSIDNPSGTPVLDNAPTAIAFGNILFGTPQTFTTFKIENIGVQDLNIGAISLKGGVASAFVLDTTGFNGTLPKDQSTTFKVALKTDKVGPFNEEITFTTNDPNIAEPFNFKLAGAIDPTMVVELLDEQDNVLRTIVDGTPAPIVIGDLLVGSTAKPAKFRITNKGTQAIDLGNPAIAGGNSAAFNLDTTGFISNLAADQSTSFAIAFNTANAGTFSGKVEFTTTDPSIAAPPFDFAIQGIAKLVLPPSSSPNKLNFNQGEKLFVVGSEGGNSVELQLTGDGANDFTQISISFKNSNGSFGAPQPLFAPLPNRFRPSGFDVSAQKFLRPNISPGQQFRIILQNIDGGTLSVEPEVIETANGEFSLRFAQGVVLNVRQTNAGLPRGIGNLQEQGRELLDLQGLSGSVRGGFTVYREAAFSNVVGFYAVDDANGTVGGFTPGSAGYARAALENRVSGLNLAVSNQGTANFSADLSGGKIYAPFLIANGTVEEFLTENSSNSNSSDLVAYFLYQGANPDGADHIRLFGNNVFGFEDLKGGGDLDFNDIIVEANIA
ncbi:MULTISPECIES: DUF4347 domain-containing protein [Spirulina sp. CCY15215]|uniref:DUF4347 domain-containing protein n=1 Tax=Spirulina sp. CCY15215 TaxID=2767591 RepID=UPI00195107A7|nr:DUF4347 domain-containing protein [Spirulina major]